MRIRVSYYGQSRQVTGVEREQLDVEDHSTVLAVSKVLADKHGVGLSNLLLSEDGTLRKSVLLPVNDEVTDPETVLNENDELSIYPAVSGG